MAPPARLDNETARARCKMNGFPVNLCSFLGFHRGWVCLKGTEYEAAIQDRRARGQIKGGDNCSGPPEFKETSRE